ncbi:tRNA (guanine-N1)-methyltransferase [uncultured Croceitalea sp.]|uniref:tRNA (guanine-N1)-methyltransferase n=1 Tax=uncultured Croceitalea sp. TaxID=1798908 RepID=UPI00374ED3BA
MKKIVILLGGLLLIANPLKAQNQPDQNQDDPSINGQFETIIRKSTNYRQAGKRYEVVRLIELEALRKNILDSISTSNSNITRLRATIAENETAISSLNTKLDETTKNLNQLTEEKDSMSFFGIMVSKGTYKLIVWSVIFGLLAFLLFFIYRFKNSNFLTQQAKSALADVEGEFEQHRRRSLEREQKISRELQDEINKNKKGA